MTKYFNIFIVLLTLIFLGGCPNANLKPVATEATEEKIPESQTPDVQTPEIEVSAIPTPEVETVPPVSFHNKCASILNTYVNDKGMVDYSTLRRKRVELKEVLKEFGQLDPKEYMTWPTEDKIAFWINAYNINMLNIIVENYPIQASRIRSIFWGPYSVRHLGDIWHQSKFLVMDEEFTLAEIDKRLFREQFDEPRVFFAISGATVSSPSLQNEPYRGDKLKEQLENQTKKFLSSIHGFRTDREKQAVYLSAILQPNWFAREFISKYGIERKFKDQNPSTRAVLNFITNYISANDISFLETGNYTIKYITYDWRLNDQ